MDQGRKMQVDSLTAVKPIEFKEHDAPTFHVKHFVRGEDLMLQVFPKLEIDVLGGRVAKAVIDTVGESGMEKVSIEILTDPSISEHDAVFIKCTGLGTDFYSEYITNQMVENLGHCLTATQA